MSDEKLPQTLPDRHLEAKRNGAKSRGPRVRRVVLTPKQMEDVEKLAYLGLSNSQIAWVIGIPLRSFERLIEEGKKAAEKGKEQETVYTAMQRGRSKGDAFIAQRIFDVATHTKNPNPGLLQFLAKARLKWSEAAQDFNHNVRNQIIFETQVGKDGIIRTQQLDDDENVIPITAGTKR